jgi:hypothetical protein
MVVNLGNSILNERMGSDSLQKAICFNQYELGYVLATDLEFWSFLTG